MSITSVKYLFFLVGTAGLYYILPKKFRWLGILAASLGFYVLSSGALVLFVLLTGLMANIENEHKAGTLDIHDYLMDSWL